MKKFDINLFLNIYIPFYMAFLLNDFASLIVILPITFMLYKNLQRNALTPMVNYIIMLAGVFLIFMFGQRAHSAIILIVSFITLYIFNGEESRLMIGTIFLIALAAAASQMEFYIFLPVIFFFTIRELKVSNIRFGRLTIIIIIFIIMLGTLIPNYQLIPAKNAILAKNGQHTTKSSTYVSIIYNLTTKEATHTSQRLKELEKTYKTLHYQQKIEDWLMLLGFSIAAGVLFTLVHKYTRLAGKKTLAISIIMAILIVVLLGYGFYKLIVDMSGSWKAYYSSAIKEVGNGNSAHMIIKKVNVKSLANKLESLKFNIASRYIILAEIALAIAALLIGWKVILNVNIKKNKIVEVDKNELQNKKEWFKRYGITSDIFELYTKFRDSFPNTNYTPREFKSFFSSNYGLDIEDITSMFEKARYSSEDLSKSEKKKFIKKILGIIDKLIE